MLAFLQVAVTGAGIGGGIAGGMLAGLDATARRLDAEHFHFGIPDKRIKQPHGVAPAADAGDEIVRQPAFGLEDLLARLPADDRLEVGRHDDLLDDLCLFVHVAREPNPEPECVRRLGGHLGDELRCAGHADIEREAVAQRTVPGKQEELLRRLAHVDATVSKIVVPAAFGDLNSRVDLWQNRLVAELH